MNGIKTKVCRVLKILGIPFLPVILDLMPVPVVDIWQMIVVVQQPFMLMFVAVVALAALRMNVAMMQIIVAVGVLVHQAFMAVVVFMLFAQEQDRPESHQW